MPIHGDLHGSGHRTPHCRLPSTPAPSNAMTCAGGHHHDAGPGGGGAAGGNRPGARALAAASQRHCAALDPDLAFLLCAGLPREVTAPQDWLRDLRSAWGRARLIPADGPAHKWRSAEPVAANRNSPGRNSQLPWPGQACSLKVMCSLCWEATYATPSQSSPSRKGWLGAMVKTSLPSMLQLTRAGLPASCRREAPLQDDGGGKMDSG